MKTLITLLIVCLSLAVKGQTKSKQIEFKRIDTAITLIAVLKKDTLFVKSNIDVFQNWFNKEKAKPKFNFIIFESPYNSIITLPYRQFTPNNL